MRISGLAAAILDTYTHIITMVLTRTSHTWRVRKNVQCTGIVKIRITSYIYTHNYSGPHGPPPRKLRPCSVKNGLNDV